MAIVRNPLNPLDAMGVTLAASPEPLLEVDRLPFTGLPESDVETTIPGEQDFAAMEAAARTYYDCLRFGSNSQMWAIIAPDVVQSLILQHFPVLRDEVTIEAWVEEVGPQQASPSFPAVDVLTEYRDDGYGIEPNPERIDAVIVDIGRSEDPRLAWIGTRVARETDGEVVSLMNPRPGSQHMGESGEVLVLIQWPGSDTWFVTGATSVNWVN